MIWANPGKLRPDTGFKKIQCNRCSGLGRLRGVRAKAGSRAAVCRRKLATCTECGGNGWIEIRIRSSDT